MRQMVELRIDEQFAPLLFSDTEGERLGDSVRKILIYPEDPRYSKIERLQKDLLVSDDKPFFYGWNIKRRYTKSELQRASLFNMVQTSAFEPSGEECGTVYDESVACPQCGSGAQQVSELVLDLKRIPKNKDINWSLAGEIVISRRVVEILSAYGLTGAEWLPVRSCCSLNERSDCWFQLKVATSEVEIVEPTRIGINPFDYDNSNEYRCSLGDLVGLNLLSEVFFDAASRGGGDFISTRQFVGTRRGVLRSERLILVSPKVKQVFDCEKLKGAKFEIAYPI